MALVLIVHVDGLEPQRAGVAKARFTLGRSQDADLPLPDRSISLRHATIEREGSTYAIIDHSTLNGTFVCGMRVSPNTPRVLRDGDIIRLGRVMLEARIDETFRPVPAANTREIALQLASRVLEEQPGYRVRVVEGPDLGSTLHLADDEVSYTIGRAPQCALKLTDRDASREHALVIKRRDSVFVKNLGALNGVELGALCLAPGQEALWQMSAGLRLGGSVLVLENPFASALAKLSTAAVEPLEDDLAQEPAVPPVEVAASPPEPSPEPPPSPAEPAEPPPPAPALGETEKPRRRDSRRPSGARGALAASGRRKDAATKQPRREGGSDRLRRVLVILAVVLIAVLGALALWIALS